MEKETRQSKSQGERIDNYLCRSHSQGFERKPTTCPGQKSELVQEFAALKADANSSDVYEKQIVASCMLEEQFGGQKSWWAHFMRIGGGVTRRCGQVGGYRGVSGREGGRARVEEASN